MADQPEPINKLFVWILTIFALSKPLTSNGSSFFAQRILSLERYVIHIRIHVWQFSLIFFISFFYKIWKSENKIISYVIGEGDTMIFMKNAIGTLLHLNCNTIYKKTQNFTFFTILPFIYHQQHRWHTLHWFSIIVIENRIRKLIYWLKLKTIQ